MPLLGFWAAHLHSCSSHFTLTLWARAGGTVAWHLARRWALRGAFNGCLCVGAGKFTPPSRHSNAQVACLRGWTTQPPPPHRPEPTPPTKPGGIPNRNLLPNVRNSESCPKSALAYLGRDPHCFQLLGKNVLDF